MGKAGKAKKKQKLLAQATAAAVAVVTTEESTESDEDSSEESGDTDLATAVSVLNTLSTRLELYDGKPMKALRIALFPLLKIQEDKFFEDPPPPAALTADELARALSPSHITATLRVAKALAQDQDTFASLDYKEFRRALHPFVLYQLRKSSIGAVAPKSSAAKIYPPGWSHTTTSDANTSSPSISTTLSAFDRKKQSLSNRVAYFYRVGDWHGALRALHELRVSNEMPKLGSLQRWVRESDVETFQLSSMKTEASSHVRDPTQGMTNNTAEDLNIIPSYAMGNDLHVDGLSAEELQKRVLSQQLLYAVLHLMQTKLNASSESAKGKGSKRKFTSLKEVCNHDACIEESVQRVVQCRPCPIFHAPPRTSSAPVFGISCAADALACLQVFQAVSATPLPVLSPSFMDLVSVVFNIPGQQRRPPSAHDLNIYSTLPSALLTSSLPPSSPSFLSSSDPRLSSLDLADGSVGDDAARRESILRFVQEPSFFVHTPAQKHEIPHVPGAFLMTDVLSPLECCQLMTMAETMHYTPDAVFGIDNVIWLGNESLMSLLATRVESLMPAVLNNRQFAGINARLRLFRYYAGAVYRPHIDGAWPGSGLAEDGTFTDDAFAGDRHSQLTFLVYLNDGFDGGATTFFLAGQQQEHGTEDFSLDGGGEGGRGGVIEARGVKPRQGSVLCFPHGHAIGSLVHEGSAVANGVKYVIRTDALYYVEENK